MRKIIFSALILGFSLTALAQTDTTKDERVLRPMELPSKDHFLLQLGAAMWQNKPDSIRTKGLSRTFNVYLMMDFPFKTNPHFSIALGPGLATDHIFLDNMSADIKANATRVAFRDLRDTVRFKKFKVSTAFVEAPIELRYSSNPGQNSKSVKAALGVKVGTLLAAWTKAKNPETSNGSAVNQFIQKEKSKRFFNTTRISATARLGYGHFSAFASYALTPVFKEGQGPKMNTMSVGLTLSGL